MPRPPSAVPLSRTSSRTRTGRRPLDVTVAHVEGSPGIASLYAGAPTVPATSPFVAGDVGYPIDAPALQVRAVGGADPASVALVVDLGAERDIARIEMYGNFLLPPLARAGRPMMNFGLPFGVGVGVLEAFDRDTDLHGLDYYDVWPGPDGGPWQPRLLVTDLRALWGWTPLTLPPTYGRYLLLVFFDLPMILPGPGSVARRGLDVQRLVVYPFVDDVDHRPQVEFAPFASRQTRFGSSRFWSGMGQANPAPETHESVFRDSNDRILLPSALAAVPFRQPGPKPVQLYSSDVVRPDTEDRVVLVLQATTDETPLLAGVALFFDETGPLPDYRISVDTSDDPEAARSPRLEHRSWALAHGETIVRAADAVQPFSVRLLFPHVRHARYVRLVVQPIKVPGLADENYRFVLAGLTVLRSRDYVLAPTDGEEYAVNYAVLRLRGPDLAADYAFLDGANGAGLTLEVSEEQGAWRRIQSFRTLLDLVENTQSRLIANPRYPERRRQRISETASSTRSSSQESWSISTGVSQAGVEPGYGNFQVSESGSITRHTDNPSAAMSRPGEPPSRLPAGELGFLVTERHYMDPSQADEAPTELGIAVAGMFAPTVPAGVDDVAGRVQNVIDKADNMAPPVTLTLGVNAGGNVSAGVAGLNAGLAVGASIQVGGGVTRTKMQGEQGAYVQSESRTVRASNTQDTLSMSSAVAGDTTKSDDVRTIERTDEILEEDRRRGAAVRYAGADTDLLLVAIPLNVRLRGPSAPPDPDDPHPQPPRDALRLRIDHLPHGVMCDVEFRGTVYPLGEGA